MSGHSKWSTIKHKKAALDAKRGKSWSKLVRVITVCARTGGGNVNDNPRLRLAIEKSRDANMPKDTIERAIKKGTGELEGESYEEVTYEGYGPGGVAVLCQALTDNRKRTAPEIKKLFEKSGGNLGTSNCVAWMFTSLGTIVVSTEAVDEEKLMEVALEAGANDVTTSETVHEVICDVAAFETVKQAVKDAGIEMVSADIGMVADNLITLDLKDAVKVMRLIEGLEDHDDVDGVFANFDLPDDVVRELSKM